MIKEADIFGRENGRVELFVMVLVGFYCFTRGMETYQQKDQNTIFTKHPVKVRDVKEYNQFCGKLMIGYGVAAVITMFFMSTVEGWLKLITALVMVGEAVAVLVAYRRGEKDLVEKK